MGTGPLSALSINDIANWFDGIVKFFTEGFYKTFIDKDNYKLFLNGFKNTLIIAIFAAAIGVILGVLIAIARVYTTKTGHLKPLDKFLSVYLTFFRGTPVLVQLMIWYFIVLSSVDALIVAIIGFGINSSAYVAEIVRGGILSIDSGQTEAGRSLGLSGGKTMWYIVLPQSIKTILPSLGNEFISLLKETSVAGLITVIDLTRAGDMVRGQTLEPFFSLFSVAIVYLLMVMGLTAILRTVERRLRKSDRG